PLLMAHKILPPAVSGPPEFEQTFRAHQNCVEFYPLFLVTLWTCGMFFSEVLAAATGLVYMAARQLYFNGYTQSTKKRLPTLIICPKNKACTALRRAHRLQVSGRFLIFKKSAMPILILASVNFFLSEMLLNIAKSR
uniref:Microsomal glutathione S-transferase 2 n=1 Tax=Poecilia mexicana TaxID=48701 RepID=A0A3B3Y6I5_9TELE